MQTIINYNNAAPFASPVAADSVSRHLSWVVTPMGLSQSAMLVYLPLLVANTQFDYSLWAQLFAMGMLTYFAGALLWPWCLPRLGHYFCLKLGLAGFAFSMLLFGLVLWLKQQDALNDEQTLIGLAGSRLLYGVFASVLLPVAQSWSAELSAPSRRLQAFSRISQQLAIARSLGPALAAALCWLHWLLLPLCLALWPLLLFLNLARNRHLQQASPKTQTTATLSASLLGLIPPLWLGIIALSGTALASSLQFQLGPALQELAQTNARQSSLLLALLMTAAAVLSVVAHRLQARWPPANLTLRQLWISALIIVGAYGLIYSSSLLLLCGIALLISMALAWLTPLYSTQLSLNSTHQHLVAAQLGITHILGHLLGLAVTAQAMQLSQTGVYIWLGMLGAVIAIASLSQRQER